MFAAFSFCANELPCRCTDDCDGSCCEVFCKASPVMEQDIHQNIYTVLLQHTSPSYADVNPSITTPLLSKFSPYTEGRFSPFSNIVYSSNSFTRD